VRPFVDPHRPEILPGGLLARFEPWVLVLGGVLLLAAATALIFLHSRRKKRSLAGDLVLFGILFLPLLGASLVLGLVRPESPWKSRGETLLLLMTILLAILAGSRFMITGIRAWAERSSAIRSAQGTLELIARIAAGSIGVLILLDTLHISITPVLTTLGVGSLAVALALQETLANFFAGLYIAADRPFRVGDYVRLDNGEEGYIERIGWRTTRLTTLAHTTVVIPNDRLAKSIVTNFDLPTRKMALSIRISVGYLEDSRRVEGILLDLVRSALGRLEGLLGDPPPFVRFIPGFGGSALEFTLVCTVAHYVDQFPVQDELRHRILERFRQEGIQIPFPPGWLRPWPEQGGEGAPKAA
jgi:small-conductance mechanosensitive channel